MSKELTSYIPMDPRSLIVVETDITMETMFEALDHAIVQREENLSQVHVMSYTEFLLKNGLEFDGEEQLNEYEVEFFEELANSYRLMLNN